MSNFYRFPAMAKLNERDNADQIAKIDEEVEHLRQLTIEKNRKRGYYGE